MAVTIGLDKMIYVARHAAGHKRKLLAAESIQALDAVIAARPV